MRPSLRIRLYYLYDHAIEAWLGAAAVVAGADFFLEPPLYERTAIGVALHPWDYGWNVLYALGGAIVLAGLFSLRPRYEAAGLSLLTSAFAINLTATLAVAGRAAVAGELITGSLVAACLARLGRLLRL